MNDIVPHQNKPTATLPVKPAEKPTFETGLSLFIKHVDTIGSVLPIMVMAMQEVTKRIHNELSEFETKNCEVTVSGDERTIKIPDEHYRDWKHKSNSYQHFNLSRTLLPRSLLVSLISQYDAYLGRLLRTIFIKKPEILNASEKKISFDALSQFSSIDEAREYILEKEVEAILRSSHSDQFKWMEGTFDLPLTKDLAVWPAFIELTERRNLFVHTDGVVSSQYIAVCRLHKCRMDDGVKEGDLLQAPQEYFEQAHNCIFEIGTKLGHVLWRKLFPDEREAADSHLIRVTYELIEAGRFGLAIKLLDFACTVLKKFATETNHLTLVVNRAQAYKWNGDSERCKQVMCAIDWDAKGDQFRLADAVLAENWSTAAKVMRRIGKDGPVSKGDYRHWPLFREWRQQEAFLLTYQDVFGEAFPKRSVEKQEVNAEDNQALISPDAPPSLQGAEP